MGKEQAPADLPYPHANADGEPEGGEEAVKGEEDNQEAEKPRRRVQQAAGVFIGPGLPDQAHQESEEGEYRQAEPPEAGALLRPFRRKGEEEETDE